MGALVPGVAAQRAELELAAGGIEARDRYYGELAGFRAGEPLRARGPLPIGDLTPFFEGER